MRQALFILGLELLWLAGAQGAGGPADRRAHIGYVYPAGGRQGTSFEVTVGGEYIYGATSAIMSGTGVVVRVVDSSDPDVGKSKGAKKKKSVIDEVVTLKVSIDPGAEPGDRELCLVTPAGVSEKLVFQVGPLKEVLESEPNDKPGMAGALPELPVLINGQILSGDADMFKFTARKGQHLVVEASARALVPYIADAVPGWFQAVLALYDARGREVAYVDDYRFNPDPVLFYDVPLDGEYRLAIRDSIWRGRADFVYRVRIGELPFITGVFPLGAPRGETPAVVQLSGRNLPTNALAVSVNGVAPSVRHITMVKDGVMSSPVPFAVGRLPEVLEDEQEIRHGRGQKVSLPVVINGRIRTQAEKDFFSFDGRKGEAVCLEVQARRLGSPLDSHLMLQNAQGEKIAENDDAKDGGEGLLTHQADSEISCRLPEDGVYSVTLSDTQGKGGDEYAYRLRLSAPIPDFELRVMPPAVSVPQGDSVPLTVHAIRRDGFAGEIELALDGATAALAIDGAAIPEGTDTVRITLSASRDAAAAMVVPRLIGTAVVEGAPVTHPAVPAQSLMQAFIYWHQVPFCEEDVVITSPPAPFTVVPQLPPKGFLQMPVGKEVSFPVTVTRQPGFDGVIRIQAVDPPKGITVRRGVIPAGRTSGLVTVRVESKVDAGLKDNLIFSAVMPLESAASTNAPPAAAPASTATNAPASGAAKSGQDRKGPPKERVIVGVPAVPFRTVANAEISPANPGAKRAD